VPGRLFEIRYPNGDFELDAFSQRPLSAHWRNDSPEGKPLECRQQEGWSTRRHPSRARPRSGSGASLGQAFLRPPLVIRGFSMTAASCGASRRLVIPGRESSGDSVLRNAPCALSERHECEGRRQGARVVRHIAATTTCSNDDPEAGRQWSRARQHSADFLPAALRLQRRCSGPRYSLRS